LREDVAIPISLTVIVLKYKMILGWFFSDYYNLGLINVTIVWLVICFWALKHDFLLKFLFLQGSCISWRKLQVVLIGVSCLKKIMPTKLWWCSFANVYRPVTLEHISETWCWSTRCYFQFFWSLEFFGPRGMYWP